MLLSGVLFIVLLAGCGAFAWLSARRPRRERSAPTAGRHGSWPSARSAARAPVVPARAFVYWHPDWAAAENPLARHPAGRFRMTPVDGSPRPAGPDDDPAFLRALERQIRGQSGASEE